VTETAQAAKGLEESEWISPVFGDIIANMTLAADLEVERLLGLGLPSSWTGATGSKNSPPGPAAEAPTAVARL